MRLCMKLAKIKTSCFFTLNNNIFITTSILECFSYFSLRFYLSVYYFCVLNSQNTTFCKQKPKYVTPTFYIESEKYRVPCIMSVFELSNLYLKGLDHVLPSPFLFLSLSICSFMFGEL